MAGFTDYTLNKWLGTLDNVAYAVAATHLSLHDVEDPGATGIGEIAVARQAITWGAAAGRNLINSNVMSFASMPGTTVRAFGIWDASTGGNLLCSIPVIDFNGDTVVAGDTYAVDASDLTVSLFVGTTHVSDAFANSLLNTWRNVSFGTTVFASLHTADPAKTGASEVTGGSYARNSADVTVPANLTTATAAIEEFTGLPAITVQGVGLWTASTAGTFLLGGTVPATAVAAGNTYRLPAGALTVTLGRGTPFRADVNPPVEGPATLKWDRATFDPMFNGLVATPKTVFVQPTTVTAGAAPAEVQYIGSGYNATAGDRDLRLIFPDEPCEKYCGLHAENWRSLEWIGGELSFDTLWPQVVADNRVGRSPGDYARLDGYIVSKDWRIGGADGKTTISGTKTAIGTPPDGSLAHVIRGNRAFFAQNVARIFIEGVAISGNYIFEGFNINAAFGAASTTFDVAKVYIQGLTIRDDIIWRTGWPDSTRAFDIAHNGGDVFQMLGPIELHCDDFRYKGTWYQGFILSPGEAGGTNNGTPSAEVSHYVEVNHRGYGGGGFFAVPGTNWNKPVSITLNDECYAGYSVENVPSASWQKGIRGADSPTDIYVNTPNNPVGTTAKDPYAVPVFAGGPPLLKLNGNTAAAHNGVEDAVSAANHNFGIPDRGTTGGDRFAFYAATRTDVINGITYNANDWFKLNLWDLNDRTPDYANWAFGQSAEPGAQTWWGRGGKTYPRVS